MDWLGPVQPGVVRDAAPEHVGRLLVSMSLASALLLAGLYGGSSMGVEGHGVERTFFAGLELKRPVLTDTDGPIDHIWRGSPAPGVPRDDFSVRWKGCLIVDRPDTRLVVRNDNGMRVFLDERLFIDRWNQRKARWYRGPEGISAGVHRLVVESRHRRGVADTVLAWAHQADAYRPVPLRNLLPPDHPDCR